MAIPRVDPDAPYRLPEAIARPYAAFGRTPVGRWLGVNVLTPLDPHLLRMSRGRVSLFGIYHHVQVTTTGHRSGQPRTVQLIYFTDGEDVVVMASSFGRPDHPAWYRNLKANPEVVVTARGESIPHVAREVEGEDYDQLFDRATRLYAGFADYHARVMAAGRHLPIIRLTPSSS